MKTDYTSVYPRKKESSLPPLWEPQILHEIAGSSSLQNRQEKFALKFSACT